MRKDKILYISLVFIIPLAIAVVYLLWTEEMPLKLITICYGFPAAVWIVLSIFRAQRISKKSKIKENDIPIRQTRKKVKVIERTVSLILLVCVIIDLVYMLVSGYPIYAYLASILLILIFSINAVFLLVTTDE